MSRPLFDIAREIASDWKTPTPQARTYLKGLYYLLGMDDRAADLDASTAVRMFLLYSKEWTGPVAERVKAELMQMRTSKAPTNAELLAAQSFAPCDMTLDSCELCAASLGAPAKCVDCFTYWGKRARLCQHCALCISPGIDVGDGAVLLADAQGTWRHLHGQANPQPPGARIQSAAPQSSKNDFQPKFRHRLKLLGRRAVRKCVTVFRRVFRRSA